MTAPFAGLAGFIIFITKRFKWINSFAWATLTVGIGILALLTPTSSSGEYYGFQVVVALGSGILFSSTIFNVQAEQPDDDAAIASTFFTFSRSFGQAIGVAVGSVVFQNTFDQKVNNLVKTGALSTRYIVTGKQAEGVGAVLRMLPVDIREVYKFVYADAVRAMWYVLIPICALGFLVTLIAKNVNLDRQTKSRQQFERR